MLPLEAPSHPDPYPSYASLRLRGGLQYLEAPNLWVASDAATVTEAFEQPACHVRPRREPVPDMIADGPAGELFGRLMRMNEGEAHQASRQRLIPFLDALDDEEIARLTRHRLDASDAPAPSDTMFRVPVTVIAALLGCPPEHEAWLAERTSRFVAGLNPLGHTARRDAAHRAAEDLMKVVSGFETLPAGPKDALASEVLVANLIGLLSQTHDATAGLIGNTLLALRKHPALRESLTRRPEGITALVEEVERHDPPVHSTKRYVEAPCRLGGTRLAPGDTVLILTASANRDTSLAPDADHFRLDRRERVSFSFGAGRHHCPGRRLALGIATHVITGLLERREYFNTLHHHGYLPSRHGRIPRLTSTQEEHA
ncbi:cytochrome P450 [Halomonas elongata]|uniref:cytochrome P450 n=1 Tax=Halomonas elongata TaxID=2746 RepID=UPI0023AF3693|nr:cytochrome P450 [Halomonas elongata]